MLRIEREHTITLDPYEELANAIVREEVEKLWADQPGLHITITRLEAKKYG